ncbi:MAG: DUF1292 domain-containing protein [Candidatus Faecousia sp.]|nr:DUF1292 domain-containing protein [Candidatus Faecousia sp.]
MDQYGSDFISIVDDEGKEYELEVLSTLEYNGDTYMAVIPADSGDDAPDLSVSILKSIEEDGEPILCTIDDEQELETVYGLIMDALYEEDSADTE